MADTAQLIVALKLQDGLSAGLGKVSGQLNNLHGSLGRVGTGIGQVAGGFDRILTRGALAAGAALGGVITTAISFEDAFAGVRKTVDATDAELADLRQTFKDMSREIPLSFEEFAQIGETAGALGIARENIAEFTRVTALLGVTTDVTSDQAAVALGQLSTVLQLTQEDYDNFGATLVDLGNKGASTESQILELAARAGAGAHLIGIANDQTLGWASAVANLGIEVEAGGTALQKFFLESLRNLQDDDTLAIMAETAGTTGDAFKTAFETDASGALTTFLVGLGKLSQAEQLAVLDALGFSDQRITRALLGLAGNTDNLTTSLEIAGDAWRENTALTTEAQKRFETTQSQLVLLKNNVRSAADTIGSELLPIINELAGDFVGFLNKPGTQTAIKEFAQDLASGIRGLISELKGTDFSSLVAGIKDAAQVAKDAFALFNNLPPDIKALAVGALVVNKATGGAVSSIAKGLVNILGGIGGGLLGRGSSPANAVWVQSTGGLGGGPGVAGGAQGFIRSAAGILLFTGIATAIGEFLAQNVTRPMDPTGFDFLGAAAASGNFLSGSQLGIPAANRFAEKLADELNLPLHSVKQGIVDAINLRGLTFDQAVTELRGDVRTQTSELTDEQIQTRREIGAGFAAGRTDVAATNTLLADLAGKGIPGLPGGPGTGTPPLVTDEMQSAQFLATLARIKEANVLPDAAMAAIGTTATQVSTLPPILTRQEQAARDNVTAARLQNDRLSLSNSLASIGNNRLSGILAKPTSFTVNANTTVNIDGRMVASTVTRNQVLQNPGGFQEF